MKTTIKIAVIAMLMFNVNLFSQGSFKNYVKNFTLNITTPTELTDKEGNTLNLNNIYKVQLVTRGTGTDTGAEYLVWSTNSLWNIRVVNSNGNFSNHPILVIEDNIVKVKTNHTSNYGVRAFVEELVTEEGDVRPNIFGSSFQWQRYTGKLFYTDGNVGIGTTSPDMKLTVKGNIHAEEVKIDLNVPAPDYVFKSDYKLRSLEEVESFIKENSHLPEIPSAKEFAKNGVMQAVMDMNLLKKIEELTLYTIEQEKKIKVLEKQNSKIEVQEKEIEELKKQNSKIQELEKLVKQLLKDKK
ncbi:hypothetical protein [Tenacibaculum discolor]|uniref:hypothetical protein n=1 Tax=Tenacibaculum discolor TaxID=361581 RepID=UPI003F78DC4A